MRLEIIGAYLYGCEILGMSIDLGNSLLGQVGFQFGEKRREADCHGPCSVHLVDFARFTECGLYDVTVVVVKLKTVVTITNLQITGLSFCCRSRRYLLELSSVDGGSEKHDMHDICLSLKLLHLLQDGPFQSGTVFTRYSLQRHLKRQQDTTKGHQQDVSTGVVHLLSTPPTDFHIQRCRLTCTGLVTEDSRAHPDISPVYSNLIIDKT